MYWEEQWPRLFYWWVVQMKSSPLRVTSYEDADFVFVPVCLGSCGRPYLNIHQKKVKNPKKHRNNTPFARRFDGQLMAELLHYLPHIREKPHVLFVNTATWEFGGFKQAKLFTFIGIEVPDNPVFHNHHIAAPYLSHEHPNVTTISTAPEFQETRKLVMGVFGCGRKYALDGHRVRLRIREDCQARPTSCTYLGWAGSSLQDQAATYHLYARHFYCFQPPGDWYVRGAFYDCLSLGALPVVFHNHYIRRVAYTDVLNYSAFVVFIPDDRVRGNLVDHLAELRH
eukprot:EG_transcript_10785